MSCEEKRKMIVDFHEMKAISYLRRDRPVWPLSSSPAGSIVHAGCVNRSEVGVSPSKRFIQLSKLLLLTDYVFWLLLLDSRDSDGGHH